VAHRSDTPVSGGAASTRIKRSFGGFLGIGDDHYSLPWQSLEYDTALGRYRTGITEHNLGERRNMVTTTLGTGPIPQGSAQ
jgi:hypothetical protein